MGGVRVEAFIGQFTAGSTQSAAQVVSHLKRV